MCVCVHVCIYIYMSMSHEKNAGQNHNIHVGKKSFERVW